VIVSFRHKGLRTFYETGSTRGIQAEHAAKLSLILAALDVATTPAELDLPPFRTHALRGKQKRYWSIWVNDNWRVTFRFLETDVELVDYLDYH
jgi:proteic killer suppression protein